MNDLKNWFDEQSKIMQYIANDILEDNKLDDGYILELVNRCINEDKTEAPSIIDNLKVLKGDTRDNDIERLYSISDVAGVNKLAPQKSLKFYKGQKDKTVNNMVVVYGRNGSGKSGYVKLLKHVCGARKSVLEKLHQDVFSKENTDQKATISYLNKGVEKEYKWTGAETSDDLSCVNIFDARFDKVFMESEGEVRYMPPILAFFKKLCEVCDKVRDKLTEYQEKPEILSDFSNTKMAEWFKSVSADTPSSEIENYCSFTEENETELDDLGKRLNEKSPADKAKDISNKKKHIDLIIKDFEKYSKELSDEKFKEIREVKKEYSQKKFAAEELAKKSFSGEKLKGVGLDIWKKLWDAALKYSEELAYKGQEFPHTHGDAVCVLCQQKLSKETKQRFKSFESFIKHETQKQAIDKASDFNKKIDSLPDLINSDSLKARLDASGIEDQGLIKDINTDLEFFQDRMLILKTSKLEEALKSTYQPLKWIEKLRKLSEEHEKTAMKYDEDSKKDNHGQLKKEQNELLAKKWCAKHKTEIQDVIKIKKAKKDINTKALTIKEKELSKSLVTDAFVKCFNNEIQELGKYHDKNGSLLKVKLESRAEKGVQLYTLQLDGTDITLTEVLSEGEKRIVCIAAFLAEVNVSESTAPLIFDDPISSLDQSYEEAFVERLRNIASNKQVVIFTHRLSLLRMIEDYAEKAGDKAVIVSLREHPLRIGDPTDELLLNVAVKAALINLKKLLDKNPFNENGHESKEYVVWIKGLCASLREILERMIEKKLLSGIVERYKPAVTTKGKIANLSKISKEDCKMFDDLMTKYSRYVHSQPHETPSLPPSKETLIEDCKKLEAWNAEFEKRM